MKKILLCLLLPAILVANAATDTVTHTFSPPPADVNWPAQIVDGDELFSYQWDGKLTIYNEINNTLFVDDNYLATGNASRISGNAMWANPRSGNPLGDPYLTIVLDEYFAEDENENLVSRVTQVQFDFAWASASTSADLSELQVEISDYDGNTETHYIYLGDTFFHSLSGGGEGFEDHVTLTPSEISNIREIRFVNLGVASPPGVTGEVAIDNLEITWDRPDDPEEGEEIYPAWSDGDRIGDYGTNALKGTGEFGFTHQVINGSSSPASFSVTWESPSPFMIQPSPKNGISIAPGQTIYDAVVWQIDTDAAPSGEYSGTFTIHNEANLNDPDDIINITSFRLYDPPVLTENSGSTLTSGGHVTISNAAEGGHSGARRASVKIANLRFSDTRFSVSGFAEGNRLDPGETFTGTVAFNAAGASAGTHTAELRMELEMTSVDNYLNSAQPVEDRVWLLTYTVGSSNNVTAAVTSGQDLGEAGLSIGNTGGGAAIVGGTATTNQNVGISFGTPPQPNPSGLASPVGVDFSVSAGLYVLQLSYANLPSGYRAADLFVEASSGGTWVPAISLNGNGGTTVEGAAPFAGSFAAYLSGSGDGMLDAGDLGAYGVDASAKTVWIVLDYEGLFQISLGTSVLPKILGISHNAGTNLTTITYQSVAGATFTVWGSGTLGGFTPIGTTEEGTGGTMVFTHQPAGAPARYFYRISTP